MEDVTIIYYSSNKENPEFERRTIETWMKNCGDLPIISVTQKPMNVGKNIVVGDVGVSGFNMFRQVLIACVEAKTKFIISCEADCLYPPDYFTWLPPKDNVCYRNTNLYVMGHKRDYFWKKSEGATHAQIIGRNYYISRLNELFVNCPTWSPDEKNFPRERHHKVDVFDKIEYYETKNPVVQIKTSDSMRHYTNSDRVNRLEIPYWGEGRLLKPKYI